MAKVSIVRRPCEVSRMVAGSTPISAPMPAQYFSMAGVESMIVPSMSKSCFACQFISSSEVQVIEILLVPRTCALLTGQRRRLLRGLAC